MGSAIGIGAMIVVFGISYALASGEVVASHMADVTESTSRMVGAGLIHLLYSTCIGGIEH